MKRARPGLVLVELLLSMSGLLIIVGLCVSLLYGLLKLDRVARDHFAEATTRDRLTRQFRLDVRAATRTVPDPDAAGVTDRLELGLPGGRIVDYRVRNGRIVRDVRNEGGDPVSHEAYRLPSKAEPRFQVRRSDGDVFVTLQLIRPSNPARGRLIRDPGAEALLARDLRFLSAGEGGR